MKIGKDLKKNNPTIALYVLYTKEKKTCPSSISKSNSNCEKQIILLVIPNEKKAGWHYLATRKLSVLLRGIKSKRLIKKQA